MTTDVPVRGGDPCSFPRDETPASREKSDTKIPVNPIVRVTDNSRQP
jgi:hypothetical protein